MRPNVVSTMEARLSSTQPRGKHAASVQRMRFDVRPWLSKKAAASVTAVLLSAMLVCPNAAFAAEWVNVGGTQYDSAYTAEDETWSWDGADDMVLNGYNGGAISAKGDLNVGLAEGTMNTVTNDGSTNGGEGALTVDQGDLTISGSGTLTAIAENGVIAATGDGVTGGDVTIDGATVNVVATGQVEDWEASAINNANGIIANGGDATITNDANVYVQAGYDWDDVGPFPKPSGASSAAGISASNCAPNSSGTWTYTQGDGSYNKGGSISIDASRVTVKANGRNYACGLETSTCGTSSVISIEDKSYVYVDAVRTAVDHISDAFGVAARGYEGGTGHVAVKDSAVYASASGKSGDFGEGGEAGPVGMYAWSQDDNAGSTIDIENSTVAARGGLTAIEAVNRSNDGRGAVGSISVSNCRVYVPGGETLADGVVRDYENWALVAMPDVGSTTEVLKGQVIGKVGAGVLDKLIGSDAAMSVDALPGGNPAPTPDPDPSPTPEPNPNPGTGSGPAPAPAPSDTSSGTSGLPTAGAQASAAQPATSQASASVNPADAKTIQASSASAMPKTADAAVELGIVAAVIAAFTTVTGLFAARKRKQ